MFALKFGSLSVGANSNKHVYVENKTCFFFAFLINENELKLRVTFF